MRVCVVAVEVSKLLRKYVSAQNLTFRELKSLRTDFPESSRALDAVLTASDILDLALKSTSPTHDAPARTSLAFVAAGQSGGSKDFLTPANVSSMTPDKPKDSLFTPTSNSAAPFNTSMSTHPSFPASAEMSRHVSTPAPKRARPSDSGFRSHFSERSPVAPVSESDRSTHQGFSFGNFSSPSLNTFQDPSSVSSSQGDGAAEQSLESTRSITRENPNPNSSSSLLGDSYKEIGIFSTLFLRAFICCTKFSSGVKEAYLPEIICRKFVFEFDNDCVSRA